jgi:hypothetical protein
LRRFLVIGQIPGLGFLAWCGADEGFEVWDVGALDAETVSEVVEEGDFEFHAGLGEAEHDVSGLAALFADGSAGDLALGDKARMSFSEALMLSGISGLSSTRRSSSLRPSRRFNRRSSVA